MTTEGRSRNRKCIRRILLVRHGMSVGNLDESIYQVLPDQAIPLSFMGPIEVNGEKQALSAGEALRRFYDELSEREDDVRVVLVHSPFKRYVPLPLAAPRPLLTPHPLCAARGRPHS